MSLLSFTGVPGMGPTVESTDNHFLWGPNTWYLTKSIVIDSASTDSGSSPTTDLRAGLLMGKVTSTGRYKPYSATATTGEEVAEGILFHGVRMLRPLDATADHQVASLVVAGPVKGGNLYGIDQVARKQMKGRFIFDDDLVSGASFMGFKKETAKTADYTVLSTDYGVLFTNTGAAGAVIFTLPTLAAGAGPFGFLVVADQTVTVASAAGDDMVTVNDASADSVAFSTAGDKIGGFVVVYANAAGTKWYVEKRSSNAMTIAT